MGELIRVSGHCGEANLITLQKRFNHTKDSITYPHNNFGRLVNCPPGRSHFKRTISPRRSVVSRA